MPKLNRFFFDQAISIDNALTTNQIIHQIINELNKMIDVINNIDSKANEYTDSQITIVNGEIGELREELSNSITALEAYAREAVERGINAFDDDTVKPRLQALYDALDEVDNRLDSKIDREVDILDTKIDRTKNELIYLVDQVKTELIELIKKGGAIYSGYTGLLTALQDEIHNIYNVYSKFFGLTWDKFHLCFDSVTTFLETVIIMGDTVTYPVLNVDGNYYHFKYSSSLFKMDISYIDNATASIVFYRTRGNYGDVNAVRVAGQVYSDENIVKNVDNNVLYLNGVPIDSLDYSYIPIQLGTYTGDVFTASSSFVLSKLNPADQRKVKITWNTLAYLTDLGVDITYDFINYYFYSDFNNVFGELILDNSIQYGLNRTLFNFNSTTNAPNNCTISNQFGQNDLPFLNNTIDYFAETVKARNFL